METTQHPLQYFYKLLDNTFVGGEQYIFLLDGVPVKFKIGEKEYTDYIVHDLKEVVDDHGNAYPVAVRFTEHMKGQVLKEKTKAIEYLSTKVLSLTSKESQDVYIKNILGDIDYILREFDKQPHLEIHVKVKEVILQMRSEIAEKYEQVAAPIRKKGESRMLNPSAKIQWLGKINVLTTLFYDLLHGIKAEGIPPLIKAETKQIEKLIVDNFIDENGNEFQIDSTINDYLRESRQNSKRAKGEILIEIKRNK